MKKICVLLELSNSIFKRQNKTNMSQQERCCYNKNDVVNPLLRSEDPLGISKFDAPKPPSFAAKYRLNNATWVRIIRLVNLRNLI
jgi:hypothetical protein